MKVLLLLCLVGFALGAEIVDPEDCTEFPCLIFNDDFDFLDHDVWEHEITMGGGGNFEFQIYKNNRSNSYTRDGSLFLKPGTTNDWLMSDDAVETVHLDMWGMNGRGDLCTAPQFWGCERYGNSENILNPVTSARLRTQKDFSFRYGRVEIQARMPVGDWLWPAFWLLPERWTYGPWPASGEIDIIESRGNLDYGDIGVQYAGTTLHWGPHAIYNRYDLTTKSYAANDGSFGESMHKWVLDWTDEKMDLYVDDVLELTIDPGSSFWDFANYDELNVENPWIGSTNQKMAPFDQKMYLILNLAVGGVGGFFPDEVTANPPKPWSNTSPRAMADFWNDRATWLPSWEHGEGKISEKAAMEIDYIKVYKMVNKDM